MTLADLIAEIRARHGEPHSCFGVDPIMGAGYRLFGHPHDGVLCDTARLVSLLTTERLAAGLEGIGYPPIKTVNSNAGPSAHFRHDNAAYVELLLAAISEPEPANGGLTTDEASGTF